MLAIDDGSNTDYSSIGKGAGFPLLHSAPMAQYGSSKGKVGTFSMKKCID
jgi:hypothetical protein